MTLPPCSICSQPAAWDCMMCGPKCAEHVRRKKEPPLRYKCVDCEQRAEILRASRADLYTFKERFRRALTKGLLGRPLVLMVVCGLLFSISALVDFLGSLLGVAGTVTAGLVILRAAANDEQFDWLNFSDPYEEIVMPAARGLVALLPGMVLALAGIGFPIIRPYGFAVAHDHSLSVTLMLSPLFWGISLVCLTYAPFALLNAATAQTFGEIFDFRGTVRFVRQRWRDLRFVFAVAGSGFVAALLLSLILPAGWFGGLLVGTAAAATGIAGMRVLAEFIFLDPEAFNWGKADESMVDLGDPRAPEVEADVVATPARTMTTSLEGQIKAALDAKDAKLAHQLFAWTPAAEEQLTPATLTRVGQACAFLEEYSAALNALLAASQVPSPESAKPLMIAAKIMDERLRDHAGAKRLFEQVIARFPDSHAAASAKKELADPRFFLAAKTG